MGPDPVDGSCPEVAGSHSVDVGPRVAVVGAYAGVGVVTPPGELVGWAVVGALPSVVGALPAGVGRYVGPDPGAGLPVDGAPAEAPVLSVVAAVPSVVAVVEAVVEVELEVVAVVALPAVVVVVVEVEVVEDEVVVPEVVGGRVVGDRVVGAAGSHTVAGGLELTGGSTSGAGGG